MNLRTALIISVIVNTVLIAIFIGRRIHYATQPAEPEVKTEPHAYALGRVGIFTAMPNDSGEIIFVGNSITEGFPLEEIFKNPRIKNRGVAGNTSYHVLDRLNEITESKPAKIFLQIGINDIMSGSSMDTLQENFKRIISNIQRDSPNTKIYVQSLSPVSGMYENDNSAIRDYNRFMEKYCWKNEMIFIDLYAAFVKDKSLDSSLTYDGLHLNGRGYLKWGSIVKDYWNR